MEQDEQNQGIYAGGQLHVSDAPVAELRAHGVQDTVGDVVARAGVSLAQGMEGMAAGAVKLMDYKEHTEGMLALQEVQDQGEQAMQRGLTAPWGSAASFFRKDGSLDQDKVGAFKLKLQDAYDQVRPSFVNPEAQAEFEGRAKLEAANGVKRLFGQAQAQTWKQVRQAGEDMLARCAANGDWQKRGEEIQRQYDAGVISMAQYNSMMDDNDKQCVMDAQRHTFMPNLGVQGRSGGGRGGKGKAKAEDAGKADDMEFNLF